MMPRVICMVKKKLQPDTRHPHPRLALRIPLHPFLGYVRHDQGLRLILRMVETGNPLLTRGE